MRNTSMRGRPPKGAIPVDWSNIRILWEAGSSIGEISARHPITSRAILYRAEKGEWDRVARTQALVERHQAPGKFFKVPEGTPPRRPESERTWQEKSTPQAWVEALDRVTRPEWGDMFPKVELANVLNNLTKCMPLGLACDLAGITERASQAYRQREPRLDQMFLQARAMAAESMIDKISADKDWKSAAWLLERGIARAEFKPDEVTGKEKLVIEINVSRDQAIASSAGVIDLTPDAGVEYVGGKWIASGSEAVLLPKAEDLPKGLT